LDGINWADLHTFLTICAFFFHNLWNQDELILDDGVNGLRKLSLQQPYGDGRVLEFLDPDRI
jgi:hypothetical protein